MRALTPLLCLLLPVFSQAAIIETVAGGGSPANGAADQVSLGQLSGLAYHGGEWYFASKDGQAVLKRDSGGVLRLVAGTWSAPGFLGDGAPPSARA